MNKRLDNWVVKIPRGRWMAGVQFFETKRALVRWVMAWNAAEEASGNQAVDFVRVPGTRRFEEGK